MRKKPEQLLIFPFGGNAREALMVALAQNLTGKKWKILGFIDDKKSLKGKKCCGVPVLGGKGMLNKYPHTKIIAVPGRDNNYWQRKGIIGSLKIPDKRFATLIYPDVALANDCYIGFNTVVMPGCVISTGVSIGNHCVILPNTVISHDVSVGDYTLIGSNVSISGCSEIGESCYVGSGSRIIQEIKIGNRSLIGMGSVVIKSVPIETVVVGCPAKVIHRVKMPSKANKGAG